MMKLTGDAMVKPAADVRDTLANALRQAGIISSEPTSKEILNEYTPWAVDDNEQEYDAIGIADREIAAD